MSAMDSPAPGGPSRSPIVEAPAECNPLVAPWNGNRYGAPDFESIKPEHILPALQQCIGDAIAAIEEICGSSQEATFANTVIPYEMGIRMEKFRNVSSLFESLVSAGTALSSEKAPGIILLQKFDEHACQSKILGRISKVPIEDLSAEDARLVRILIRNLETKGTPLTASPASENVDATSLATEVKALQAAYSQAVKDSMAVASQFELELGSLSDSDAQLLSKYVVASDASGHEAAGGHRLYSVPNQPDVVERVISQCSVRAVREKVWTSFRSRGAPSNYGRARSILMLRQKISSQICSSNHAVFKMRHSMVSNPEEVIHLFRILLHAAKQVFQTELTQLLALSRSDGVSDFMQWDYRYYAEKLRRSDASLVSSEELPTFRLPAVVNGLVWLSQELYGITMSSASDAPRYHTDAVPYSLQRNGSLLGLMYVDVWTRAGKATGSWAFQMIGPASVSGSRPVVSLNCNFGRLFPDDPERLNLDHVKRIMHEFGHCLHCLLSDVKYTSMSGMSTADDHVELPSILHEQFLHDPEFLSRITASPLPFGICNRLLACENKSVGYTLLRNISSSILDLRMHMLSSKELETLDLEIFEKTLYEELEMPPEVPFIYVSSAFDHSFRFDYRYYM